MGGNAKEGDVWRLGGVGFECTSSAVPEEYDATCGIRKVGYVRLRAGTLRVACPDITGETVLRQMFADRWKGEFESAAERTHWLRRIAERIMRWRAERAGHQARTRRVGGFRFVEGWGGSRETHAVRVGVQEIATLEVHCGQVMLRYTELERRVEVPMGGSCAVARWSAMASEDERAQWMRAGARALRAFIERAERDAEPIAAVGTLELARRRAPPSSGVGPQAGGQELDARDAQGRRAGYIRIVDGQTEARAPDQGGATVFEGWCGEGGGEAALEACVEALEGAGRPKAR